MSVSVSCLGRCVLWPGGACSVKRLGVAGGFGVPRLGGCFPLGGGGSFVGVTDGGLPLGVRGWRPLLVGRLLWGGLLLEEFVGVPAVCGAREGAPFL